ncbi:MAG: PAS domain S-box/diguanylate cyclase (GGDEF) domain-containing protein, partial [bacterium]
KEQADMLEKNFKEMSIEDEELYKILMINSPIGIYVVQNGRFKFVNNKFKEYTGFSDEELLGRDALSLVLPEDRERVRQNAILMLKGKSSSPYEFRVINKKGEIMWTLETVASITYRGQRATLGNYMDITGQKAMEEAIREREERFRAIIENIEDGYGEIDMDANLTFFNDSFLGIVGYTRDKFMGMNLQEFIDQEDLPRLIQALDEVRKTGKASRGVEIKFIRKGGARRYIETSISLIKDVKGQTVGFRGIIRDTTDRRDMEDTIRKLAYYDSLTGLPNRLLLKDRLKMTMAHAKRNKKKLALMMLDLDKFKEVNDTLGHQMGDWLLQRVGDRLTDLIRESDAVTRMGGDEFVVLLPEISRTKDSMVVAKKTLASFQEPFLCDNHKLSITTSIGIAIFPDHGQDGNTLMKHADIAMYQAKGKGGNNYQIFT